MSETVYLRSSEQYLGAPWMFRLDCTVSESVSLDVEWTTEACETGGNVSDYGWYGPTKFEVSGIITSTPMQSIYYPLGLRSRQDAVRLLERITKERQELWVTSPNWVRLVVITSFNAQHNQPGGAAFEVTISMQTIERAQFLLTELPVAPEVKKPVEVCECPNTGSAAATAGAQDNMSVDTSGANGGLKSFAYTGVVERGQSLGETAQSVYPAATDAAIDQVSPGGPLDIGALGSFE